MVAADSEADGSVFTRKHLDPPSRFSLSAVCRTDALKEVARRSVVRVLLERSQLEMALGSRNAHVTNHPHWPAATPDHLVQLGKLSGGVSARDVFDTVMIGFLEADYQYGERPGPVLRHLVDQILCRPHAPIVHERAGRLPAQPPHR